MSNPADTSATPRRSSPGDAHHPQRLRISLGPHMIFTETIDKITVTQEGATLKLEATYTPQPTELEQPTDTDIDAPPGWADDNPGLPD